MGRLLRQRRNRFAMSAAIRITVVVIISGHLWRGVGGSESGLKAKPKVRQQCQAILAVA